MLRDEIRRCFSENETPVHAAALLDEFPTQSANQNLRSFLYKYIKLHKMATGIQVRDDFDLRQKFHFLKRLRNTRIANKIGRSGEFKDYNNFSLAMCFGRALEMEGEFQVGVKCIATGDPEVMAIEIAKMSDAEICQVTQGGVPPRADITSTKKYNPNPCFRCGLPGHIVVDCLYKDKEKPPEIGGKIHHFLETNTPVDRELWAEFFNKCVKAQAVKKFRRYCKKFQEAVTTAQGATGTATTVTPTVTGTIPATAKTIPKKVTFAKPLVEPKNKSKQDPRSKPEAGQSQISQPTPKKKPSLKVKKEVNVIDGGVEADLTSEEQEMLQTMGAAGGYETDTADDTEDTSDESESEETE